MLLKTVVRDEARVRVHAYGAVIGVGNWDVANQATQPIPAQVGECRLDFREAAAA